MRIFIRSEATRERQNLRIHAYQVINVINGF